MIELISIATQIDRWSNTPSIDNDEFWQPVINTYGFKLRVIVSKDIPVRHTTFSYIRNLGADKYDEIFKGTIKLPSSAILAFPERHCSFEEVPQLISKIVALNKAQNYVLKQLDILTSSPYIISDSLTQIVSIIAFEDGEMTYSQDLLNY